MLQERLQRWGAARQGKRDGKTGVPSLDQGNYPPSLLELRARGGGAIQAVIQRWADREKETRANLARAKTEAETIKEQLIDSRTELSQLQARHEKERAADD